MNAVELHAYLNSLGVKIDAENGHLRVRASRGQLTEEIKTLIATRKSELLELVTRQSSRDTADLVRVPRSGLLPLSSFQQRLWIIQRLEPENTAYNMAMLWVSPIANDAGQLETAVRDVVRRQEILRTAFRDIDGEPRPYILSPNDVQIETYDLRDQGENQQQQAIKAAIDRSTKTSFDLTNEAPVRFELYRLPNGRVGLLVAAHHIALDAWSFALLTKEITTAYANVSLGDQEPPPLQYIDYAAWQKHTHDPAVIADELQWWEHHLAGAPQFCLFPPDRMATGSSAMGAVRDFVLDSELSNAIRAMAREESATIYMVTMAACAVILHLYTGLKDIVLGSPMGVRERPEFETMLGPFVNLLLLRIDLDGDPSFSELISRCRSALLDAHAHRNVPIETLIERLKPVRSLTHTPLFQVALVQHNASSEVMPAIHGGGAVTEVTWYMREVGGRLENSFEYRSDLYKPETINRIAEQVEAVLRAAVADRTRRISEIAILTPQERQQVTVEFNATSCDFDKTPFPLQFERQVALTPNRCAVCFEGVELTYDVLNRRANQLARYLRSLGVGRSVLVGLCLDRSLEMLITLLAIQKAEGAYVPLDPGLPTERLKFMVRDSGLAVLLGTGDFASDLDLPDEIHTVDLSVEAPHVDELASDNLGTVVEPEDLAYVIYTSGSTGQPKGVAISHSALANFLGAMKREPGLSPNDVFAAITTISFDISGLELYLPLLVGARIELVPSEMVADGTSLAAHLAAVRATIMQATPVTWRQLIEGGWQGLPNFRALCGGETMPRDLADALVKRVHEVWNLYGPTETTIWSTIERVCSGNGPISIGRPIANTQVYVVAPSGEPLGVGMQGEIWIGGRGVATGYYRRPDLSAERFLPDHLLTKPGGRLYRTGDLGRWGGDGRLYHHGRIDHQIKIRGFRIELGEIEATLRDHPAVRQAVVVAYRPVEETGGSLKIVAYVVYKLGEDLTTTEVRHYLRRRLPENMVPSVVVALDVIPVTPNGKVDRNSLPDPFKKIGFSAYERPASGTEIQVAEIWKRILKIDQVGAGDNFFELGGHSLLALRVSVALEKEFGCRMDPRALFFQNLREIALSIGKAKAVDRKETI